MWLNEPFELIFFLLKKRPTPLCTSPPLRCLFLNSTSAMWNKGERRVYYSAISASRASLQVKQMERVCELQTWPEPQQLQHGFTPVTDFIANCGEPEYGEVVVIKRFNGMLGALDFDCFFSPSCAFSPLLREVIITATTKPGLCLVWLMVLGRCRKWIAFLRDDVQPVKKKIQNKI